MSVLAVENKNIRSKIHPKKFALWVACASISMMFAAFTSAYIVRHAAGNWLEFPLPNMFFYSAGVMLLSSMTLHGALIAFKRERKGLYRSLLVSTFILGLAFVFFQYLGWQEMVTFGVPLTENPSGDFIYVISGVHAAHVLGGVAALIVAMVHGFGLKFRVTSERLLRLELTATYWHFVDFLWIYLLIFFFSQQ